MGTKKLIIANWKMNLTVGEGSLLMHRLDSMLTARRDVEVVIAPSALALQSMHLQIDHRKFKLAAQNFYWRDKGAYTGEVSAHQLRGLVKYALIGHSERRHVFGERGRDIGRKVQAAVRNQIVAVLCVGETAGERSNGETASVLQDQLVEGLHNLTAEDMAQVVIAYEPVWAISGGKNFATHEGASSHDCEEAHAVIRRHISHLFGKKIADSTPVLYGGSVSADNARGYLKAHGVDGLLVGGASLSADQFSTICEVANEVAKEQRKGERDRK